MFEVTHFEDEARRGEAETWKEVEKLQSKLSRLKKENELLRAALQKISNGRFHIGNDAKGNVFGLPDAVMCRNIALTALEKK
jgi:hypothetical protein